MFFTELTNNSMFQVRLLFELAGVVATLGVIFFWYLLLRAKSGPQPTNAERQYYKRVIKALEAQVAELKENEEEWEERFEEARDHRRELQEELDHCSNAIKSNRESIRTGRFGEEGDW